MKFIDVLRLLVMVALQFVALWAQGAAPTIASLANETTYVDHPILVELPVHDAETPTNLLTFKLSTSNPALVDTNKNVLFRWFTDGGPGYIPRWYMTLAPTFGLTGTATNTVTVSDGTNTADAVFVLTVIPPPVYATRFANTNPITLPNSGVASQYPSTINVSNMLGAITNVVLTFSHLTHTNPNDLHMLLVSPAGQKMVFWSKVGGGGPLGGTPPDHHVTNITATITDDAPDWSPLPEYYYIWTEKFRPGDYATIEAPTNNFPAPAPAGPYAAVPASNALHQAFQGADANGTWSLYIYDDASPYGGKLDGGWSLTVSTTGPLPPTITDIANQNILTNTATAALPFTINDPDTALGSLVLTKGSSNPLLVPTNNIVFGGSGSNRTVTVTPAPGLAGVATITVFVSDGTNVVSDSFQLSVFSGMPTVQSFTNGSGITINDASAASPYPSTINVSGMSGTVGSVTLTLRGMSHEWGRDVDALLVGPGGQKLMFMSDAGTHPTQTNANFTFSDSAATFLAVSNNLLGGTYKPTDYEPGDVMPAPAPTGPYATNLAVFADGSPNGAWSLYVADDGPGDTGSIAGGWSLTITTSGSTNANTAPVLSAISNQVTVVNTATAALPFTISDAETVASNLVLTVFSSNTSLVPTNRIVLGGGSGTNRTVTVTPSSNQLGSVTISLNVSDGALVASNSFVLTVNPAVLTVTENSASRGYGLTNPVLSGSVSGLQAGDNISASFSSLATTNSPVGVYAIAFSLSDPGNKLGNYSIVTNNGTLTVTNAILMVSAVSTNKVYGTTLNPTNYSVTGLLNNDSVTNLTLTSAGSVSNAPVGSYPINASGATGMGLANYLIGYTSGTLVVNPALLTVSANSTNKTYGSARNFAGTEFTISSGVLFSGTTLTNVTLASAGAGTNTAIGTYPITVTNAVGIGLSNYLIAYNPGTLAVSAASLLVSASNTNKVYGATLNPADYLATGLMNGDTVTNVTLASAGSVSNAPVGSYAINASGALGVGLTNYTIGYSNGTLTVGAASLLITAGSTNKVYGVMLNPTSFTASGLLNGDAVTNVTLTSAGSVSNAPVGSYAISASGALGVGLINYTIGYSNGTLTVGAANLLISAVSTNKVYGVTLNPTSFTASGLLNGDAVTNVTLASAGSVSSAPVGGYAIGASGALGIGLTNYTIGYSGGTLTVGVANLLITADSTNKIYGVTFNPTNFTASGLMNGDTVTNVTLASPGSVSNAPVGSYAISASGALGIGLTNYTIGYSGGTLTVGAANLLITAGSTNKVYGATLNPVHYAATGLLNGDTVTNVTLASAGSVSNAPVGSYVISASSAQGSGLTNYEVGYSNGTLTVSPAGLLVTAGSTNKVYGATLHPAGYSVSGLLNGDTVTNVTLASAGSVSNATVGGYPINASAAGGVGLTNYSIGYSNGTLTVGSASLLIVAADTNKVYGTTLNPAGYIVTGLVNSDSVTNVTLTSAGGVSNAHVGSYPIMAASVSGVGLVNYSIGYGNGTLTVGAANLLITAADTNKVYGTTLNPTGYVATGLLNGDHVTNITFVSAGSASGAPVGTYGIVASGATGAGLTNYAIGYSNGTLTVDAGSLLITAGSTNKVYGGALTPVAFAVTGLANGDTVTNVTLTSAGGETNASVGNYAITASGASGVGLTNYSIGYSNGTLAVSQAVLMVTADNKSRVYGQPNPVFTLSYAGFVNGEGTNVLDTLPAANSAATSTSAPGDHVIATVGGADNNYLFNRVDGTLTITAPSTVLISSVAFLDATSVRITGTGDANVSYKVLASSNLSDWTEIGVALSDGGGAFEYVDGDAGSFPARYYRIATP